MVAHILDGKACANSLRQQLEYDIAEHCRQGGNVPSLAVILVGSDPASEIYVRNKRQACQQVGIIAYDYNLPNTVSQAELFNLIDKINADPKVYGILIQLPLPKHINSDLILERIDPRKDVDGFHPYTLGRLVQRRPALRPCTPYGVMLLLEYYQISLYGINAVVVGASNIVGRPMALELLLAGCTVTICHRFTRDLAAHVQRAELLVIGIGKPGIVQSDWIKPGAIVVDIGINRLANGIVCGDLDFATASKKASWITPVPGGVGPMTVATLLQNTWQATQATYSNV